MESFTIGRAWALGLGFIRRSPSGHALLLIVMAAVAPALVQWGLFGAATSMMGTGFFGSGGAAALGAGSLAVLAVTVFAYVLTAGGYFGSWRLGLGREVPLGGAVTYGLIAGLAFVGLAFAAGVVAFLLAQTLGWVGTLIAVLAAIPLLVAFLSMMTGTVAVSMLVMALFIVLFGAASGRFGPALGGFDMGAATAGAAAVLIAIAVFFLWLAARLCCVAPAMAARGSLNVVEAFGESWRLTGRAQGRIMLYLALVGLVFALLYVIFMVTMVSSTRSSFDGGSPTDLGGMTIGILVFGIGIGIVGAYLSVLVPAGIYRALQPDVDASAAVFE